MQFVLDTRGSMRARRSQGARIAGLFGSRCMCPGGFRGGVDGWGVSCRRRVAKGALRGCVAIGTNAPNAPPVGGAVLGCCLIGRGCVNARATHPQRTNAPLTVQTVNGSHVQIAGGSLDRGIHEATRRSQPVYRVAESLLGQNAS